MRIFAKNYIEKIIFQQILMRIKRFIPALIVAICCLLTSYNAQAGAPIKFGLKAGMTVNDLKFNESIFSSDNRCGYTLGVMTKFTAPLIGIGFDASVMFTHRVTGLEATLVSPDDGSVTTVNAPTVKSDYIEIPINLRWDINLPVVGSFVTPFLTTGPDFSFLVSKQNAENAWKKHTFDVAWNFGVGLLFVKKVQLHASYGLGLNNAASADRSLYGNTFGDAKNRFWTVTAAYLF